MAVITYDQVFSNTDITELDRGGLAEDPHFAMCLSACSAHIVAVYASTYMQL